MRELRFSLWMAFFWGDRGDKVTLPRGLFLSLPSTDGSYSKSSDPSRNRACKASLYFVCDRGDFFLFFDFPLSVDRRDKRRMFPLLFIKEE